MPYKNIDAISRGKIKSQKKMPQRRVFVDSIITAIKKKPAVSVQPKISAVLFVEKPQNKVVGPQGLKIYKFGGIFARLRTAVNFRKIKLFKISYQFYGLGFLALALTFTAGSYAAWNTDKSFAENHALALVNQAVLGESNIKVYDAPQAQIADVPNEVFFSLTLEQLENYLAETLKTPEMKEAEKLAERKIKLKAYLEYRRSPFVEIVNTIAELKHWKLVLAVSNSESSLGKRCYNNNCSGIGVEPGHPLWRDYKSKSDWAKDLDRLLEKRYKNWTLEKMNGVYNQPGSQNWLMASKQVLEELQERGIE